MIVKLFNDHFKFATNLTIITKSNVSEIGPLSSFQKAIQATPLHLFILLPLEGSHRRSKVPEIINLLNFLPSNIN